MDRPIQFDIEEGTDHLVRFQGFYHAKSTGGMPVERHGSSILLEHRPCPGFGISNITMKA